MKNTEVSWIEKKDGNGIRPLDYGFYFIAFISMLYIFVFIQEFPLYVSLPTSTMLYLIVGIMFYKFLESRDKAKKLAS